jgi:Ca2+-binding EF-hand superfamily protein
VTRYLGLTLGTLLAAGALAQAQSPAPGQPASVFDTIDADRNGSISIEEAKVSAVLTENFAAADTDGDNVLTRQEFDASFTTAQPQPAMPSPADPSDSDSTAPPTPPGE